MDNAYIIGFWWSIAAYFYCAYEKERRDIELIAFPFLNVFYESNYEKPLGLYVYIEQNRYSTSNYFI